MKTTYYFDEENKFHITNLAKIIQVLGKKKVLNGDVEFIGNSDNISHQQRKYFFGKVVKQVYEHYLDGGYKVTKEDIRIMLNDEFLFREHLCSATGKYRKVPISLSNSKDALSKEEFQFAKELIQHWGATDLGIIIDDPDPNWKMYKENGRKD